MAISIKNTICGTNTSDATVVASDILLGEIAYGADGRIVGTIPSKSAATLIPTTSVQTIAAGQYLAGAQTISAVPTETKSATPTTTQQTISPTSGKFLSAVTVGAIPTKYKDTSSATAVASDLAQGKVAFNASGKITGTAPIVGVDTNIVQNVSFVANTTNVANWNGVAIPVSGTRYTLPQCLAGFVQFLTTIYGASSSNPLTFRFTTNAPVYIKMVLHGKRFTSDYNTSTEVDYSVAQPMLVNGVVDVVMTNIYGNSLSGGSYTAIDGSYYNRIHIYNPYNATITIDRLNSISYNSTAAPAVSMSLVRYFY